MSVFDRADRDDCGPRPYAEPDFRYLNRSARPGVQAIRESIESWFIRYPNNHSVELRGRLRSSDNDQHRSAFFELFLHELLLRLGCTVEVHPQVAGVDSHPDFRVSSQHSESCYLEATLASDETREQSAAKARMNEVYDALNRLDSPNFFIEMRLRGAPATPPSARSMREFLSPRLAALDFDEVARQHENGEFDSIPRWEYQHDGWSIEFRPIPKSDATRGRGGVRPLGILFEQAKFLRTRDTIRDGVVEKAGCYGELDRPYVIAVNILSDHIDRTDEMESLFGSERYTIHGELHQAPQFDRAPNGAWFGPNGIQNTRVSAAFLFPSLSQSNIGWTAPRLYHNPWATRPYCGELDRLNRAVANDARHMTFLDGESLRSIFDLPENWPGE
jgi:hypothetical protein